VVLIPKVTYGTQKVPREKKEKVIFKCVCCGQEKDQERNFYKTSSILMKNNNQRMAVCKQCVVDLYSYLINKYDDCKVALYFLCRLLDVYFESTLYYSAEQQANNSDSNIAQIYFQKVNSLPQYGQKTFAESAPLDYEGNKNIFETEIQLDTSDLDKRNQEDVIRMVGYDPFFNENPADKKYLYNTLVDFLDESTLEDSFKLPTVIEIVKSFNQIDKINQALAIMTADVNNVANSVGGVKSLFEAKDKMYRSLLALAKDNGISVNHATNKSKGAGTLSGIIKKLQELGFDEVDVNLFDIETSDGIKQVAEISNQSILNQLMFDENDYTEMIKEQRLLLENYRDKYEKLEEENRLLKLSLVKVGDN
jgi:transcription elongation factor Elf1